MGGNHASVTGAWGMSTYRAAARAAKAALHMLILCPRVWVQDEISLTMLRQRERLSLHEHQFFAA